MDVSLLRVLVVVFVCLAMGCEAMNFLAYPRLGRRSPQNSKQDADKLLQTVLNGQFFALPRGRRMSSGSTGDRENRGGGLPFPMPRKRNQHLSYLAFPRLGRAQSAQAGSDDCCPIGLKNEWLDETEKSEVHNICQSDVCCIGLKEIIKRKPDGVYYSMCIPTASCSNEEVSKNVIGKLKDLLRK